MGEVCKHRRAWPTVWHLPNQHGFEWCPRCGAVRVMGLKRWLRPVAFHLLAGRDMSLDARPDLDDVEADRRAEEGR